jgi:hypothetical protein
MLNRALIVMFLATPLAFSGCDTVSIAAMDKMGYAKQDILSSRGESGRDAQNEANKDIQRALTATKGELLKAESLVDQLIKTRNRSIAEADKFIQSMEKEPA